MAEAMDLVDDIYRITGIFPKREVYSLTDQIRRAAVSVPSNIAEGQAHFKEGEFIHFLRHARGSLAELETQMLIAQRQNYATKEGCVEILKNIDELSRILNGVINSIRASQSKAS